MTKKKIKVGKPGRNDLCKCGSGLKWKHCCGSSNPKSVKSESIQIQPLPERPDPKQVTKIVEKERPLMPDVPNILIAVPWTHHQVSAQFTAAMVNLALVMPFPSNFEFFKARHTADARNVICLTAIDEGYSHIFMVDADQYVSTDTFNRLWKILEEYGHDNIIASAWATIRGGQFEGNTSVLFDAGDKFVSPHETRIPKETFQAYSVGTPGMLFCTKVLEKIQPPWFADLLTVDNALDTIKDKGDGGGVVYWPLERRATHDYVFGIRMTEAGVKIMVDPECKLPHEIVESI